MTDASVPHLFVSSVKQQVDRQNNEEARISFKEEQEEKEKKRKNLQEWKRTVIDTAVLTSIKTLTLIIFFFFSSIPLSKSHRNTIFFFLHYSSLVSFTILFHWS